MRAAVGREMCAVAALLALLWPLLCAAELEMVNGAAELTCSEVTTRFCLVAEMTRGDFSFFFLLLLTLDYDPMVFRDCVLLPNPNPKL